MRSTLEPVEPTKVRINVVVEPDELRPAIDRTARRLSREVRVPGFRKGKVPRQVIEARIGRDALLAEAIEQEAVPEFYAKAIEELGVQPLSRAQVEPPDYTDGEPLEFSATFEIKPELDLPPYRGRRGRAAGPGGHRRARRRPAGAAARTVRPARGHRAPPGQGRLRPDRPAGHPPHRRDPRADPQRLPLRGRLGHGRARARHRARGQAQGRHPQVQRHPPRGGRRGAGRPRGHLPGPGQGGQGQGPAQAGRRLRPGGQRVRHPGRAQGRPAPAAGGRGRGPAGQRAGDPGPAGLPRPGRGAPARVAGPRRAALPGQPVRPAAGPDGGQPGAVPGGHRSRPATTSRPTCAPSPSGRSRPSWCWRRWPRPRASRPPTRRSTPSSGARPSRSGATPEEVRKALGDGRVGVISGDILRSKALAFMVEHAEQHDPAPDDASEPKE